MITFLTIIFLLIIGTLSYVIWNLLRKLEALETIVEENTNTYIQILNAMKEIDSTGAFESDDEVGSTFQDLKNLIEKNQRVLNGNN